LTRLEAVDEVVNGVEGVDKGEVVVRRKVARDRVCIRAKPPFDDGGIS
jgi:hypothetical protein